MTFGVWNEDVHSETKQIPKIAKAAAFKDSDIVSLDEVNQSAVINGSEGSAYEVTLNSCTCGSFKDGKPCKHIYFLAIRLGLFDGPPEKNSAAAKAFKAEIPNEIARYRELYFAGAISAEKFAAIAKAIEAK